MNKGIYRAGRRRNHFPFHVWLAQNWIGQRNYLAADVCTKIAHSPQKLLREKNCSRNLLTENQICSGRIMNFPSFYLQSKHGRMTQFLSTDKLLKAKKICSQKRKTAHKNQICSGQEFAQKKCSQQKFAHRICSQHRKTAHNEKPCWLGWINTMARDIQANWSTAGAQHSTVSVVKAGTCWAGPSWKVRPKHVSGLLGLSIGFFKNVRSFEGRITK